MAQGGPYSEKNGINPVVVDPPVPAAAPQYVEQAIPDPNQGLPQLMQNDRAVYDPNMQSSVNPNRGAQPGEFPVAMADAMVSAHPVGAPTQQAAASQQAETTDPRTGRKVSVRDVGFAWQPSAADWAPAGYRPNESRSASVGKYGGSPLFSVALAFPNNVIANRMQALVEEKKELKKAYEKVNPQPEDVDAPEYRDGYIRAVNSDLEGYRANIMRMHGDENGMALLSDPNSKERRGLEERADAWTTISRTINQATKAADAVIVGMNDGSLEMNPILLKQAEELRRKTGSRAGIDDPKELAKGMQVFVGSVSLADRLKADGVIQIMKEAGSVQKLYERAQKGSPVYDPRFSTLVGTKELNTDAVVNSLTDYYHRQYKGDLSREQVFDMVKGMAPELVEQDIDRAQYSTSGGGSGSGTRTRAYGSVENIVVPEGAVDAQGNKVSRSFDAQGKPVERPSIVLKRVTNGQGVLAGVDVYKSGADRVDLVPTDLVNVDNQLFIVGKQSGLPKAQAIREAKNILSKKDFNSLDAGMQARVRAYQAIASDSATPEQQELIQQFHGLQDMMIPVEGNWNTLQDSFGITKEEAESKLGITLGGATGEKQATKKASSPFYDSKDDPPPSPLGARWSDVEGAWLVKSKVPGRLYEKVPR